MAMALDHLDDLVSVERGEVDRRIFSDPDIFEQELELIFGRAWQFMCHESQIKKAGDFVEVPIGRDNVLIVRQKDKSIKGLLNTCAHRGNAVCRAEEGNTKNFMCTYHGWTYDLAGNLIGVPGLQELYKNELDRSQAGLRPVAQIDSYRGFVFATMDPGAPPLSDYLGTTSRLALDLLALRGDMEVVPGIQKFVIPCNWKFAVDNLFDWYHPQITHMSANGLLGLVPPEDGNFIDGGGATTPDGTDIDAAAGQRTANTTNIVVLGEYGHAIGGPNRASIEQLIGDGPLGAVFSQAFRDTPEAREILGTVGREVAGHPNIFPNTWITNMQLSLRIPRSPNETEIWWYSLCPRELPPEHRGMLVAMANHVFGPAGFLEQEDGENWAQSTLQTYGIHSRRVPQLLKMNLGNGKIEWDNGLAHIDGNTTEHAQLWTYHSWQQWMSGCDWDELRARTQVPDVI
ncbi:MAG: hypothetical protein QOC92_2811 [Acidimicrobiaceae bacterium]|jgi:3-phenylpropionate/trans-cinnamate dioxygenase alpha subunit